MLNFITGLKGSGKTEKAHEILGECVKNGGDAMLIVPKQFTFESDKGILSVLGPRLACEVEVLSFTRLSHVALQKYGGIAKPILKGGSRLILMSLALEAVQHELTTFSRHATDISLVTRLLGEIDELKNNGIEPEELEVSAEKISDKLLRKKIKEIALIYKSFQAVIQKSFFDDADLLKRVYEILSLTDFFKDKTIAVDGFSSFSFYEIKLIELMMKQAKNVYITLCTDNITDMSMLSVFYSVNKTARKIRLKAGNNGIETNKVITLKRKDSYAPIDIEHLHSNIYKPVITPFSGESENVNVIKCSNEKHECDFVARKIKKLIRQENYRCRDIAVVYRSEDTYQRLLLESFKKYGVPHFEDKRQPVINQPLVCFIKNLLQLCSDGFNSDYLFRYLKAGLTCISTEEISEIENYVFMWDIDGAKWLSEWTGNPDGFGCEMNDDRKARLEQLNLIREKIISPVIYLKEKLKDTSGKDAMRFIYEFLRENKTDEKLKLYALLLENDGLNELAIEQEQVWDLLMETLDEIANSIGEVNVKPQRLSELFSLVISDKSLGKLPDGFDEVYLCSADRMITKSAKVVFVVGMNEGVFPSLPKENGVIYFKEKSQLKRTGLDFENDVKEFTCKERFLVYNCFASATEKLYVSYSLSSSSGEKLIKSEAVTMIFSALPLCSEYDATNEKTEELIESEKSAFEIMASLWHEKDSKSLALKEYFKGKEEYHSRMNSINRAVSGENFAFSDRKISEKLFGENMRLSASQLEVYGNCPFMYFCRYGLNAKKRQAARLDPAQSGTVVHYVLEMILAKHKGKEFLNLTDEQITNEIRFYLSEYIKNNMGGSDDKQERFNYLFFRMEKILFRIFERLIAEFSEGDFEPCGFEVKIEENGNVEPVLIKLENGNVMLRGVVDRVDKMELRDKRYIRVVDYKTGAKEFLLSDVLSGLNMQMLLYLISIWKNGKGIYEDIVPAGVLYFPARMNPYTAEREDTDEQKRDKRFSAGRMNGMLVGDEQIIAHMEKDLKGRFIPAKVDKRSGVLKGNFISAQQLEKLSEKMNSIIANMGNSLHNGLVPAKPAYGPGHTETCAYCDFGDVCLKENPKYRYIPKLKHEEALNEISGGESDENKMDR